MELLPERFDPAAIAQSVREFWKGRGLPPADGRLGSPRGVPVLRFVGAGTYDESALSLLQRLVLADAEGRVATLSGRRTWGKMIARPPRSLETVIPLEAAADHLSVWGMQLAPEGMSVEPARVQDLVSRLASLGLIVTREGPLRICPACGIPRTPEGIVYQEEQGPACLVRFPIAGSQPKLSALVWVDAVWKLLGTIAIVLNPDLPYVSVLYRRKGVEEFLLVAKSAVPRLGEWFPNCETAIVEERKGTDWAGAPYEHPLRTEYPVLSDLAPPAGTIVESTEVGDSGTGFVALVPSHGAGDAALAQSLRIASNPVLGVNGKVEGRIAHKYAGLSLADAEAFIVRDLSDSGYLFAELRVRRGVPRCSTCGTAMVWVPARAWTLEPARLAAPLQALFAQLLPDEPFPRHNEVVPWPVSERAETADSDTPVLLECMSCERLAAPDQTGPCECGGQRSPHRRRLLPALVDAFGGWTASLPIPAGPAVRMFVSERRRASAVIHHLVTMQGLGVVPSEARLIDLPILDGPLPGPDEELAGDAVRTALIRVRERLRDPSALAERSGQEARRLRRFVGMARAAQLRMVADNFTPGLGSILSHWDLLSEEDRAFASVFERMRFEVRRDLHAGEYYRAHARLVRFLEDDLHRGYLTLVAPRRGPEKTAEDRLPVHHVLAHVFPGWAELYSPFAPATMDAVCYAFRGEVASLFEAEFTPVLETILSADSEAFFHRLQSLRFALDRGRTDPSKPFARLVLVANDEAIGQLLRQNIEAIRRVTRAENVEIGSPSSPWTGRTVSVRPVSSEIHKVYGNQESRVIHMLAQFSGKRIQDGLRAGTLSVALEGRSAAILPSMVELVPTIPAGLRSVPWELGEMYVQEETMAPSDLPALSLPAYRVIRTLSRRLRKGPAPPAPVEVFLHVPPTLRAELEPSIRGLAKSLGVDRIWLTEGSDRFMRRETTKGVVGRGLRFALWIPGLPRSARPGKRRGHGGERRRVRVSVAPGSDLEDSAADEAEWAKEAAVREALADLDSRLGIPILGPTKLANAWDAGLRNADDLFHAPYEQLSRIPGFGPVLAAEIVHRAGGHVPEPAPRVRSRPATETEITSTSPSAPDGESPETPPAKVGVSPAPQILVDRPPPSRPLAEPAPPDGWARPTSLPVTLPAEPPPVVPEPASPPPAAAEFPQPPAEVGVLFVPGPSADPVWKRFLEATGAGLKGLCVSREFPDRLKAFLGPRNVSVIWLSNLGGVRRPSVRPADLPGLESLVRDAVESRGVLAVYLDGIEYLARVHAVDQVISLLHRLEDSLKPRGARMYIPANPELTAAAAMERLQSEFPEPVDAGARDASEI